MRTWTEQNKKVPGNSKESTGENLFKGMKLLSERWNAIKAEALSEVVLVE